MTDYWSKRFRAGKIWGDVPSSTTRIASEYFQASKKDRLLVIGSGYGRNANFFHENGYQVEGIEYSKDAIAIARKDNPSIVYYQGSVFDMPFSNKKYSSIYCYNVIHLFFKSERDKLISLCREILDDDGLVFFSAFSDEDRDFGIGKVLEDNTFEVKENKVVHFYGEAELVRAFNQYKILEIGTHKERVGDKSCRLRYIVAQNSAPS